MILMLSQYLGQCQVMIAEVIMAAGAFIQGSSIELSADAPIKPPYNVYFQGGLTFDHSKIGALKAYQYMKMKK